MVLRLLLRLLRGVEGSGHKGCARQKEGDPGEGAVRSSERIERGAAVATVSINATRADVAVQPARTS